MSEEEELLTDNEKKELYNMLKITKEKIIKSFLIHRQEHHERI